MKFSADKYKVMHIGKNNLIYLYTLLGSKLTAAMQEKGLDVIMDKSVKTSPLCNNGKKKQAKCYKNELKH